MEDKNLENSIKMRLLHCTINNKKTDFALDESIDDIMLEDIKTSLKTSFKAYGFYIEEKSKNIMEVK